MVQTAPVVTVNLLFGPRNTVSVPAWQTATGVANVVIKALKSECPRFCWHDAEKGGGVEGGGGGGARGGMAAVKQRLIAVGESLWT